MNSQNYNRYSYVLNNPMSYTDPSGYFFNKLFKKLNKALGKFAPFVAIGLAILGQGWAAQGLWQAAAVGFVSGGIATGSLKGALIGAFSGAVFHGIGKNFGKLSAANIKNGVDGLTKFGGNMLTSAQIAGQIASHAVAGGVISVLGGGKFGHGFLSAGITKGAGGAFLPGGENLTAGEIVGGTIGSAVIAGTVSEITGGKFANGARTGAFQFLFNQASKVNYSKIWQDMKRTWSDYWDNANSELSGVYAVGFESTGVRGNLAVKGGYGVFWDTKEGVIDFYQKVGYNPNPLDFSEAYGYESSAGFSFDYSRNASDFFGQSTEYSVSVPFSPVGLDAATTYGPGVVSNTSFGFDIGWGGGASMVHMTTTRQ